MTVCRGRVYQAMSALTWAARAAGAEDAGHTTRAARLSHVASDLMRRAL